MDAASAKSLAAHRITAVPDSMYYIPDFITAEEGEYIVNHVSPAKWITLSHRRLQALPARVTAANILVSATGLPEWLQRPILDRFEQLQIFKGSPHGQTNHCLINEYLPGQGIMPHEDGPAYHPVVATVSLGGVVVLEVSEKMSEYGSRGQAGTNSAPPSTWRILQEPRSLLVTTGTAYTTTLHGIAEVKQDPELRESTVANWHLLGEGKQAIIDAGGVNTRATRVSLTFRDVRKVSKLGSTIFGKAKS